MHWLMCRWTQCWWFGANWSTGNGWRRRPTQSQIFPICRGVCDKLPVSISVACAAVVHWQWHIYWLGTKWPLAAIPTHPSPVRYFHMPDQLHCFIQVRHFVNLCEHICGIETSGLGHSVNQASELLWAWVGWHYWTWGTASRHTTHQADTHSLYFVPVVHKLLGQYSSEN